jgi:5,10-methylenetetrahydrofolate reductase
LSISTLIKDTTRDTRNYTSIAIETIAKTTAIDTTWVMHVNVIAATTVNQMIATTNGHDEDGINETIATIGDRDNRTTVKMSDPVVCLLRDKATILAL